MRTSMPARLCAVAAWFAAGRFKEADASSGPRSMNGEHSGTVRGSAGTDACLARSLDEVTPVALT